MHSFQQTLWLAYRDFMHERRLSFCFVLALMAVLGPLLVLFGLKFGLIDTLARRLVESPHNREIIAVGSGHYNQSWFEDMAAREDVAFIIPNTRRIAASFTYLRHPGTDEGLRAVQMIPTGPRDPLLEEVAAMPAHVDEVVASYLTAHKLGITVGETLEARIDRRRNERDESVTLALKVIGVTPEAVLPEEALFVPLELLVATEDYRDGLAVSRFGWPGAARSRGQRDYARFRLYAKSIYDVGALRDALRDAGIEVRTQATEIEAMQALDRNLSRVFWLIASIGTVGFLASLAANLLANVERKQRELSVVGLLGVPTKTIVLFPVTQAGLVGILGALAAVVVYFPVALVLNTWFASSLRSDESICHLLPSHFLAAFSATLLCAVAAAAWAGLRAARIEPAEGIRDV